jgi:AcrR family transcriptional regulator
MAATPPTRSLIAVPASPAQAEAMGPPADARGPAGRGAARPPASQCAATPGRAPAVAGVGARVTSKGAPRSAAKGQQTRAVILDAALGLASHMGLEGLSIGALAEVTQMSKSGVFAHFGSREELQISVIREYHARFEDEVFFPSMREPRGLPRLRSLFERWIRRVSVEIDSGCIYISGAVEFDDRPGPVRDALASMVGAWHAALERAIGIAVEEGHLRPDTDATQMLFEIHGLILALHHDARFLRHPGVLDRARAAFERVIAHYRSAAPAAPAPARAAGARAARRRTPSKT